MYIYSHYVVLLHTQQNVCSYRKNGRGATATGVVTISSGDESSLVSAVSTVGPVSAYVDASHTSFQVSLKVYLTWAEIYSIFKMAGMKT